MYVYKVEIMVVDLDELGPQEIKDVFENIKYPNHCMSPEVMDIEGRDIGEWDDEHPLNNIHKSEAEYRRLFNKEGE